MTLLSRLLLALLLELLLVSGGMALAADPEVVIDLQRRGDAFVVDARIDIPVALRTAWEVLTDFDHMAGVLSNLSSSRIVERDGGTPNTFNVVQQGTVRYGILSFAFFSEREVRLEPMKRIVARQVAGTARQFQSETQLSPTERGTRLRYQMEVVPDSGLARAFGASFVEHEVAEQLTALAGEMLRRNAR